MTNGHRPVKKEGMNEDNALLERLETELGEIKEKLKANHQLLKINPGSESLRDCAAELRQAAERLGMVITKLRSKG
jgi:hypothetical protein